MNKSVNNCSHDELVLFGIVKMRNFLTHSWPWIMSTQPHIAALRVDMWRVGKPTCQQLIVNEHLDCHGGRVMLSISWVGFSAPPDLHNSVLQDILIHHAQHNHVFSPHSFILFLLHTFLSFFLSPGLHALLTTALLPPYHTPDETLVPSVAELTLNTVCDSLFSCLF